MRKYFIPLLLAWVVVILPFAAEASINKDLKLNDRGDAVRQLQDFLINKKLLTGPSTGNFYNLTKQAVVQYQKSLGLPATGFAGALTRQAINKELTTLSTTTKQGQIPTQNSGLVGGTPVATSSIAQTYDSHPTQFTYDPTWSKAVVNLLCVDRTGGYSYMIGGTGVIIDPRGVILTNAHVGFYFTFANWPEPSLLNCTVRTGSPATNEYTARLIYIPQVWSQDEIMQIARFAYGATSTLALGEKDYALLLIDGYTDSTKAFDRPSFPYIPFYQGSALPVYTSTYLIGYPAENLGSIIALRNLFLVSTPAQVDAQRPLEKRTTPDVIAFSGSINSQHGASGGAVIANGGKLAGLLTFLDENYGSTTGSRILNAITTGYIQKDFAADNGVSISSYLSTDLFALEKSYDTKVLAPLQYAYAKAVKSTGGYVPGVKNWNEIPLK